MVAVNKKFTPEEYEKSMRIRFWGVIKEIDRSEKGKFRQSLVDGKNEIIQEIKDSNDETKVDTDKFDKLIKINSSDSASIQLRDTKTLSEETAKVSVDNKETVWKQLKLYELVVEESFGNLRGEARTNPRKEEKEKFIEMIFGLQQDFLIRILELKDEKLEEERAKTSVAVAVEKEEKSDTVVASDRDSKLDTVNPVLRQKSQQLIEAAAKENIEVRVAFGYRTLEQQQELYSKGRNASGNVINKAAVVTNAPPGKSWHNFGLAVDFAIIREGKFVDDGADPSYKKLGKLGKDLGLAWGGDFKSIYDPMHFQYTGDISLTEANEIVLAKKDDEILSGTVTA